MRIVFEFRGQPQVQFGGKAYIGSNAEPPEWRGMQVDGVIVDVFHKEFRRNDGGVGTQVTKEGNALYIEGDLCSVREACEMVLDQLKLLEQIERERLEGIIKRTVQCATCKRWYDTLYADDGHGDGLGNTCYPPSVM